MLGLIARDEHGIVDYTIAPGPRGSLDWDSVPLPPQLTDEELAEQSARWIDSPGVSIEAAKPRQMALTDAWAEYHENGDPTELIEMGVLPDGQEEVR